MKKPILAAYCAHQSISRLQSETIKNLDIIYYAFDAAIDVADAMSDGGIVQDSESNEIYVERWVIEG